MIVILTSSFSPKRLLQSPWLILSQTVLSFAQISKPCTCTHPYSFGSKVQHNASNWGAFSICVPVRLGTPQSFFFCVPENADMGNTWWLGMHITQVDVTPAELALAGLFSEVGGFILLWMGKLQTNQNAVRLIFFLTQISNMVTWLIGMQRSESWFILLCWNGNVSLFLFPARYYISVSNYCLPWTNFSKLNGELKNLKATVNLHNLCNCILLYRIQSSKAAC